MEPLKFHLTRLFDFQGRENRGRFWLWVAICYAFQTVLSMFAAIPLMIWMVGHIQGIMARGPRAAPPNPQEMFEGMQPMMLGIGIFGAITGAIFIILIGSAVVRRLHDRNLTGWLALPVLLCNVLSQVSSVSMLASGKLIPDPQNPYANVAKSMGLFQFLALGTLIVLIVLLVLRGTQGPNRYGRDPLFEL